MYGLIITRKELFKASEQKHYRNHQEGCRREGHPGAEKRPGKIGNGKKKFKHRVTNSVTENTLGQAF